MNKYDREYDSFGPWILPIRDSEEVPDAFLESFQWSDAVERAYKIPRPVERRKVREGENLYDYLVVFFSDRLEFLAREGVSRSPESDSVTIPFGDILIIRKMVDLLRGELRLETSLRSVLIPFNSVSEDMIDEMIVFLRERYIDPTNRTFDLPDEPLPLPKLSQLYSNLLRREREREEVAFVAYQKPLGTEKREKTFIDRLAEIYSRWTLRESMVFTGRRELFLYRSSPPVVWLPKGYYGYEWVAIPRSRLKGATVRENRTFFGINDLVFRVGDRELITEVGETGEKVVKLYT